MNVLPAFRNWRQASKWIARHGRGRALHVVALHDPWCLHGTDHACTCEPEILIEDLTAESLTLGARGQRTWLARHRRN